LQIYPARPNDVLFFVIFDSGAARAGRARTAMPLVSAQPVSGGRLAYGTFLAVFCSEGQVYITDCRLDRKARFM
jgi:hypothetical protein